MIIATITDRTGQVSAVPATHWTPIKRQVMEAGAMKAGLTLTYSTR